MCNIKKLILVGLIILVTFLTGCLSPKEAQDFETERYLKEVKRIKTFIYVKDERTNLCFMSHESGSNWGFVTNVPCTTEVENLIKNP